MSEANAERLARYIRSLPSFVIVDHADGHYDHMGATISDGILQAGIAYESVVRPRINAIRQNPEAKTTSGFISLFDAVGPEKLLQWRDREKPARIRGVAGFLQCEGIETEALLAKWLEIDGNVARFGRLRGIGPKTLDYFRILVGIPAVAIDSRLTDFLHAAGVPAARYEEKRDVIVRAAQILNVDASLLDHSIWKNIGSQSKTQKGSRRSTHVKKVKAGPC